MKNSNDTIEPAAFRSASTNYATTYPGQTDVNYRIPEFVSRPAVELVTATVHLEMIPTRNARDAFAQDFVVNE